MQPSPVFESISPNFGSSFSYQKYASGQNNKENLWHYHPEIELVYIDKGAGKRQIGSHISYYTEGDLILIGSDIPHCGFTDMHTGNKSEIVVHMKKDFLGYPFFRIPEMKHVLNLFEMARGGVAFGRVTKNIVGAKLENLEFKSDFDQLLSILDIFNELGNSQDYKVLNGKGFTFLTNVEDNDRLNLVFNHVRNNFKEKVWLSDIAAVAGMTEPSFCRYFKKITGKTFVQFLNEYRLVHASKLLAKEPISITEICFECGFNNFSHFNKSFKLFTGQNPSEYRNSLKMVVR